MSFFTSFCDLPQKLQLRVSRFSTVRSPWLCDASPLSWLLPPKVPPAPRWILLRLLLRRLLGDHLVDEAVLLGLAGPHEVVAIGVALDPLEGLLRVAGEDLVQLR